MSIDYKQIGKRLQKVRKKRDITQQELAEYIDVSVGYISQIERGVTKPNLIMIDTICSYLECDLIYILKGISEHYY